MPASTEALVLCRHCPAVIRRPDPSKRWEDEDGSPACAHGSIVGGDGKVIQHTPLPVGFRGGVHESA